MLLFILENTLTVKAKMKIKMFLYGIMEEFYLHIYIISLVVFAAIDSCLKVFGITIVRDLSNLLNKFLSTNLMFDNYFYITAGVFAVIFFLKRDNWLPFLGQTVFPKGLLKENLPEDYDKEVSTNVGIPNAKVIYWASYDTKNENTNVFDAYGDFANGGVTTSNEKGDVVFKFNSGTGYIVPGEKYIKRHVHYRVMKDKYSILGRVKTVFY